MNKLVAAKNCVAIIAWTVRDKKTESILPWLRIGSLNPKFDKIYLFCQHSHPFFCVLQKNWNSCVCLSCKFWILWSAKRKYLLNFDDSCEEIWNPEAFADIAAAGRHDGVSTIYIKRKLFFQSKLVGDVEVQKTYIVHFKPPRIVMQVSTLTAKMGLERELVDW